MNRVLHGFGEEIMPIGGGQLDAEDFIAVEGEIGHAPQPHPDEEGEHGGRRDG